MLNDFPSAELNLSVHLVLPPTAEADIRHCEQSGSRIFDGLESSQVLLWLVRSCDGLMDSGCRLDASNVGEQDEGCMRLGDDRIRYGSPGEVFDSLCHL